MRELHLNLASVISDHNWTSQSDSRANVPLGKSIRRIGS